MHDDHAAWLRALESHQTAMLAAIEGADDARSGIVAGVTAYLAWLQGVVPGAPDDYAAEIADATWRSVAAGPAR